MTFHLALQRYLRLAGVDGHRNVRSARLRHAGTMTLSLTFARFQVESIEFDRPDPFRS